MLLGVRAFVIEVTLGHSQLTTTQIYTRVSIRKLKEIHTATHPAAKLERRSDPAAAEVERGAGGDHERRPEHAGDAIGADREHAREELLTSLAAEALEGEENDAEEAADEEP